MQLENISRDDISEPNIPTGGPRRSTFGDHLAVSSAADLGDADAGQQPPQP